MTFLLDMHFDKFSLIQLPLLLGELYRFAVRI